MRLYSNDTLEQEGSQLEWAGHAMSLRYECNRRKKLSFNGKRTFRLRFTDMSVKHWVYNLHSSFIPALNVGTLNIFGANSFEHVYATKLS